MKSAFSNLQQESTDEKVKLVVSKVVKGKDIGNIGITSALTRAGLIGRTSPPKLMRARNSYNEFVSWLRRYESTIAA
jgi:hypothetical protein